MEVLFGTLSDINSWMELVNNVSWNFSGRETVERIEEHRKTVLEFINQGRALCVKREEKVVGVLLFSKKMNMICCLAVDPNYRRQGIASITLCHCKKYCETICKNLPEKTTDTIYYTTKSCEF